MGGDASNSVDLNTIPTALIERVEVLTGGASAVYGPDAVAGVVNVILKRDYEGFELATRTLVSERGDGRESAASLVAGIQRPDWALALSAGWASREEIGKGDRPFSEQAGVLSSFYPGGAYVPGLNPPSQAVVNAVFNAYGVNTGLVSNRGGFGGFAFNADGTLFSSGVPANAQFDVQNYRGSSTAVVRAFFPDAYGYNFEPFNKLVLPLERESFSASARRDFAKNISVRGLVIYTTYDASTALAPTPAPTDPNPLYPGQNVAGFTIPVSNPFIPADLRTLLASRTGNAPALAGAGPNEEFLYRLRTTALGARQSDNSAQVVQAMADLDWRLGDDWKARLDLSSGRYERHELQSGLLSVRRFELLLDSPTGGTEFCAGGLNPFGVSFSDACREFVSVRARYATRVAQDAASATLSGPALGFGRALFGIEHRTVRYRFVPPSDLSTGEAAGFIPTAGLRGSVRSADAFAEVVRPLNERATVTLGYRASSESEAPISHSAKADLSWRLRDDLRVGGSLQRAVRSPDIFERFQTPRGTTARGADPCSSNNPARSAEVLDLCRRQAVQLGFAPGTVDAFQYLSPVLSTIASGNRDLEPETARTATLGAVWSPTLKSDWLRDLHLSVHWHEIAIEDAIAYRDAQTVVDACYNIGAQTNPGYDLASPNCAQFARSAADFTLVGIATPQSNQAFLATSGVDLAMGFRADLAGLSGRPYLGALWVDLGVSWLARFEEQISPLRSAIDYAGTIGGGNPGYQTLPRWKGNLGLAWERGPFEAKLSARALDAMEHRLRRTDSTAAASGVGAGLYWDSAMRLDLNSRAQLRAGVVNLFDRGPELYSPATDANTEPSTYDVVGRRFWVGLTLR